MAGGLPGKSFMVMEFEESGAILEVARAALAAGGLDVAETEERFLELAGEATALDAKVGDEAVGVYDCEVAGAGEEVRFDERDAVEAPGGVDEFLDELGFGGGGGLVFGEKLGAMRFVCGPILGGEDGRGRGQAMTKGVQ